MDQYMPIEADTVAEMRKILHVERPQHKLVDKVASSFSVKD